MNISSPPPRQNYGYAPSKQDSGAQWHQEFSQQHNQAQRNVQDPAQGTGIGTGYAYYPQPSGSMAFQQYGALNTQSQSQHSTSQQVQPEVFDDAAFAKAFEQAADLEEERETQAFHKSVADWKALLAQDAAEFDKNLMEAESKNLNLPRIGADTIRPQETEPTHKEQQEAPDELARTAGSLLRSVENDQSSKFQGSQFLSLMRLLRDKEVTVQGDDIVAAKAADVEGDAERAVGESKGARPSDYLDMWDSPGAPLHSE